MGALAQPIVAMPSVMLCATVNAVIVFNRSSGHDNQQQPQHEKQMIHAHQNVTDAHVEISLHRLPASRRRLN